jgi:hypothetical protein
MMLSPVEYPEASATVRLRALRARPQSGHAIKKNEKARSLHFFLIAKAAATL